VHDEAQSVACGGMGKAQFVRPEGYVPAFAQFIAAVFCVAEHGTADVGHLGSDLVTAACYQFYFNQGYKIFVIGCFSSVANLVVQFGTFCACSGEWHNGYNVFGLVFKEVVDKGLFALFGLAYDNREIGFFEYAVFNLFGQSSGGFGSLCIDHYPARYAVKAMYEATEAAKMTFKLVQEVVVFAVVRTAGGVVGLDDHDGMVVFMDY